MKYDIRYILGGDRTNFIYKVLKPFVFSYLENIAKLLYVCFLDISDS